MADGEARSRILHGPTKNFGYLTPCREEFGAGNAPGGSIIQRAIAVVNPPFEFREKMYMNCSFGRVLFISMHVNLSNLKFT